MTGGVLVDGVEFRPRRLTGRALLDLQAAEQVAQEVADRRAGLEARMHHLAVRLERLAESDGEFDVELQERLTAERAGIRALIQEAQADEVRAQMGVLLARCEPQDAATPEWCMEHIAFPGDFERIMRAGDDADPPPSPATTGTPS